MVLNILKKIIHNKTFKRIFSILVIVWLWYLVFSVWTDCFAQTAQAAWTAQTTESKIANFNDMASEIIRCLYVILWPLLFVCWVAVDNSLLYWEWLHLDVSLYTIWNIMKNFANFALGFLVVLSIVINLFSLWKWWWKLKPKDVITKTLIAWVLIQMSRFLPAAVIDVSTILTYSIWWLPMTVLEKNTEYKHTPVLWLNATVSSSDNWSDLNFYYTYWNHKVAPCKTEKIPELWSWTYIIWPKTIYYSGWIFDTWYCVIWGAVYRYNHVESWENNNWLYPAIDWIVTTGVDKKNTDYRNELNGNLKRPLPYTGLVNDCVIISTRDSKIPAECLSGETRYWPLSLAWDDPFFTWADGSLSYTIDNILEKSKWMVWPFVTIYSSLLDVQSLSSIENTQNWVFPVFTEILYKLFFLAILVLPLVGLAIVLITRVWILWITIAAAPILVLLWVFKDMLGGVSKSLWDLRNIFELKNIIKLIFAPVIVVFAISISIVFLTALDSMWKSEIKENEIMGALWIEHNTGSDSYSFAWWLVELDMGSATGTIKDNLADMITMIFATWIIRFFLMAAVKACGKTWETWWGKLQDMWTNFAKTMPIVPIWWGVWVWTLTKALSNAPDKYINKMRSKWEENLPDWLKNTKTTPTDAENSEIAKIVEEVQKKWTITNEQLKLLAPAFGWATSDKMVDIIKRTDAQTIQNVVNNYNSYTSNKDMQASFKKSGEELPTTHTSADALNMTALDLGMAVQNDKWWKSWAAWMIWWSVHTSDWVRMVDIIPGTENDPIYEIVTREKY